MWLTAAFVPFFIAATSDAQWVDGWLVSAPGHVCAVTKRVHADQGKFTVSLSDNGTATILLSVSNESWTTPAATRLPYIALKAGKTLLADGALTASASASGFGPGLIFRLQSGAREVARTILDEELTVWDAREPKKLFAFDLRSSASAMNLWSACGAELRKAHQADPFRP